MNTEALEVIESIETVGHFINGRMVADTTRTQDIFNPATGRVVRQVALAGKATVEEAIAVTGKHLFFFYAWQAAKGPGQLPGVGPTDCTPWIEALAKADYKWYVNPFMHHEPEPDEMEKLMAKSCDYLKECYAKAVPD